MASIEKILAPALLYGLLLSACEKAPSAVENNTEPMSTQSKMEPDKALMTVAPPEIIIENGSPDSALKSWWRVLDLKEKIDVEECNRKKAGKQPGYVAYFPKVAQENALKAFAPTNAVCLEDVYERDIQEVKTESETRAVAFVKIKNITPIPSGAEPDEYDKQYRKDGFRFKYLLEKSSEGWKVSQVYKYDEINFKYLKKDPWEKIYKVDDKPRYPAFVHKQ